MARQQNGDHDAAIADFTKAIEMNPKFGDAYSLRATAYCKSGKRSLALDDIKKAIELGSNAEECP